MAITNTSDNPKPGWLMGGNPRAIEAQEAQGQRELVASSQLPAKINPYKGDHNSKPGTPDAYIKMGIEVIGISKGDSLFYDVKLPERWKIVKTDHAMWSNLQNENDEVIGNIFYKAAFYDRDSFINIK